VRSGFLAQAYSFADVHTAHGVAYKGTDMRSFSLLALIAAAALTAGTAGAQNPNLHQPDQNPAHQMHYSQKSPMATSGNPMVGGAEMYPNRNIVQNAMNSKDHTTLVAAIKAAGLVDTLSGPGPFTVFAPTNEAHAALPAGTLDTLLKPENKAKLVKILTCHVVAGKVSAGDLSTWIDKNNGAYKITTLGGCVLTATKDDAGMIWLTDETGAKGEITIADVQQSNGVIHVVDKVLLPAA
jgi:uncharacterized surface protein with fasciclin (FAS1) repeats